MDRAEAVGVHRAVTVADDLDSARWVVAAAEADPRVFRHRGTPPDQGERARRGGPRGDREAGRRAPGGGRRGDRAGLLLARKLDGCAKPGEQREAFAWHIDLAKRLGKNRFMIHDRDAHAGVLDVLRAEGRPER